VHLVLVKLSDSIPYVQHRIKDQFALGTAYLLIEYVDPSRGKMLSETWEEGRHNIKLRTNLFHGLSRIMLALARIPLPKIGTFTLDEKGYLSLNNRPLTQEIQQLENEHIPVDMPQNTAYATVDSYVNDIRAFHESRLRHQRNAVNDVEDGFYQTSALMIMRSVWSCFSAVISFEARYFLISQMLTRLTSFLTIIGTSMPNRSGVGMLPSSGNDSSSALANKSGYRFDQHR
jgi:hypothetical protein